jgi:ATP-dependent DNA helicase RecG
VSAVLSDAELLALLARLDQEPADALESHWLDFKDWDDAKSALKVACEYAVCFANAEGGTLVFGVSDRVVGRGPSHSRRERF